MLEYFGGFCYGVNAFFVQERHKYGGGYRAEQIEFCPSPRSHAKAIILKVTQFVFGNWTFWERLK